MTALLWIVIATAALVCFCMCLAWTDDSRRNKNVGCAGCLGFVVIILGLACYCYDIPRKFRGWLAEVRTEEEKTQNAAMQAQRLREDEEKENLKAITAARALIYADREAKNEADAYAIKIDSCCDLYSLRETVLAALRSAIDDAEKFRTKADLNDPDPREHSLAISFRINRLSALCLRLTTDIRRAYLSDCMDKSEDEILRKYSRIAALARSEFDEIRQGKTTPGSEKLKSEAQLKAEESGCDVEDLFDDDALANRFRRIAKTGSAKKIFACVRRIRRQRVLADVAKWAAKNGCPLAAQELAIWSITDKSLLQELEKWDGAGELFLQSVRERIESL